MLAGDEMLGKFVYCTQHLRVHSTGWCTVDPKRKVSLPFASTVHEAKEDWNTLKRDLIGE